MNLAYNLSRKSTSPVSQTRLDKVDPLGLNSEMRLSRLGFLNQQPDQIHGLVFDGATFLANFYVLGTLLSSPLEEFSDKEIGLLLGLGIFIHLVGALLKKGPLQQRLAEFDTNRSGNRENLLGCLSFIHFIFFLIATAMALALVGFTDLNESGGFKEFLWVTIAFVTAAVISGTVWQAVRQPGKEVSQGRWWRYQEIPANLLLWLSATILTRFFWDALLFESEPPSYIGFNLRAFVLIAATSALFMVFYVPARLLFLAEDYKYPITWFRLWLVAMLPMLAIVFFR